MRISISTHTKEGDMMSKNKFVLFFILATTGNCAAYMSSYAPAHQAPLVTMVQPQPLYGMGVGSPVMSSMPMQSSQSMPFEEDSSFYQPQEKDSFVQDRLGQEYNLAVPKTDAFLKSDWDELLNYCYRIIKNFRRIEKTGSEHEQARTIVDEWKHLPEVFRGRINVLITAWQTFKEARKRGFGYEGTIQQIERPRLDEVSKMSPSGTYVLQDLFTEAGQASSFALSRINKEKRNASYFGKLWGNVPWRKCKPLSIVLNAAIDLDRSVISYLEKAMNSGTNRQAHADFLDGR